MKMTNGKIRKGIAAIVAAGVMAVGIPALAAGVDAAADGTGSNAQQTALTEAADSQSVQASGLTAAEDAEFEELCDKIDAKWDEIFGSEADMDALTDEDFEDALTDEDFEARYAQFERETAEWIARADALEAKLPDDMPLDDEDWDTLSEAEAAELTSLYDAMDAKWDEIFGSDEDSLSDAEYEARVAKWESETKEMLARVTELEEKGWPEDADAETETAEYGDLSEAEIAELNAAYDAMDAKWDEIFGNDEDSLSDAEYDTRVEQYERETAGLAAKIDELEKKAGLDDESWLAGSLTAEEMAEYNRLCDEIDSKWDEIFGNDADSLSEAEIEARYAQFAEATSESEARLDTLREKVLQANGEDVA